MNCLIGADPELFVRKGQHFISGHIFECGTKERPLKTEHGHVQVDGMALEVNVNPSRNAVEFFDNLSGVLRDLNSILSACGPGYSLVARPSVFFGARVLGSLPPFVARLGCSADFSAYTKGMNEAPNAALPFRTGAGHIHIGWTKDANLRSISHFNKCIALTQNLDYYLGLPSLLWDKDNRRRLLYGKAGAFRPKHYGMEYRVPSNAWLKEPGLVRFVYEAAVRAFEATVAGKHLIQDHGVFAKEMIDTGNSSWIHYNEVIAGEVLDNYSWTRN